jgi:ABC-type polysaccharide/polyol phosphate export permease
MSTTWTLKKTPRYKEQPLCVWARESWLAQAVSECRRCRREFGDVNSIVEVLLSFEIFFTPVFYDVRMLGDKGQWLLLNPVPPILDGLSACIARHQSPQLPRLAYGFGFGLVALFGGYAFFKHLEPAFAEGK